MSCKLPHNLSSGHFHDRYNNPSSSSSYLMGSSLSQDKSDRYHSSNSEYGKSVNNSMGSGVSSHHSNGSSSRESSLTDMSVLENLGKQRNFRYGSYERTSRSSPQVSRPLPQGPGPLLPNSCKMNRMKQEKVNSNSRGPLKASHDLNQRGISRIQDQGRARNPEVERLSMSRAKSRSLSDISREEPKQDQKASADKLLTDVDLRRVRRTFKISRSPSCDNINSPRQLPDDRALLDKMSKIRTDEASRKKIDRNVSNGKKIVDTLTSKTKPAMTVTRKLSANNKATSSQKAVSGQSQGTTKPDISNGHNSKETGRRDSFLQPRRKMSDSAYESMSTTSSSSSSSSPKQVFFYL